MKPIKKLQGKLRPDARSILRAALEAADSDNAVRAHFAMSPNFLRVGNVRLRRSNYGRVFLVAAGKAAVPMSRAIEEIAGDSLAGGVVVTKHGHLNGRLRRCSAIEAGHPIPDEPGEQASRAVEKLAQRLTARDLLIVAISGGASALLSAPAETITLSAKQKTTDLLLRAGADIHQLNTVRKHLSRLKGGRLAQLAYPATVVSLLLSDVIGDSVDVIGSGPTAPDTSTFADALAVLEHFNVIERVPQSVRDHLESGRLGSIPETPKPGDPVFEHVHNAVIGSNRLALEAAAKRAKSLGYRTLILSSSMQGETREVATVHAQILRETVASGHPLRPPACLISGGETTVTIRGNGKGGRNQEFALAAALNIAGLENVLVMSTGTDGTDGPTDAAGAFAAGDTLDRARLLGLDAGNHLARNDSYAFFDALGDLIKTGPTGTNVMDIHVLLAG